MLDLELIEADDDRRESPTGFTRNPDPGVFLDLQGPVRPVASRSRFIRSSTRRGARWGFSWFPLGPEGESKGLHYQAIFN